MFKQQALLDFNPSPDPSGQQAPSSSKESVAEVDDADVVSFMNGPHDVAGNILWPHEHGVGEVVVQQGGIHESRSDIEDVNG